jgi:hypothetical protein
MAQSNLALERINAALREENVRLRTALTETTIQLTQTLEELKICALPLFRQWRLRRLLRRRAKAVEVLKEVPPGVRNIRYDDGYVTAEPSRIERAPLIVVPR